MWNGATQVPGGDQAYWRFRHAGTPPFHTGTASFAPNQKPEQTIRYLHLDMVLTC